MKKRQTNLDLFGNVIPDVEPAMSRWLRQHDSATFEFRRARAEYLKAVYPRGYGFLLPLESSVVLDEAKLSFLNGADLATVVLAQAFVEHVLQSHVEGIGHPAVAKRGLKAIIEYVRKHEPQHEYLIGLVDEVRRFRNPFMHLREFDDPDRLTQRLLADPGSPEQVLEVEAKRALAIMYQVAVTKF